MDDDGVEMEVRAPTEPWPRDRYTRLQRELGQCPDVAFAHLPEVLVAGHQREGARVLFVWLVPEALRSLRAALNAVSEIVARVLPSHEFLDVVVLNSAPELLEQVEAANCLLVEPDAEERAKALQAAAALAEHTGEDTSPQSRRRPWWWPFGG
jgi:hypothetical protein